MELWKTSMRELVCVCVGGSHGSLSGLNHLVRACMHARTHACVCILPSASVRAQTSGLCASECRHQIRLFIITATLITREDSGDRRRLRKHPSAERRRAKRLLTLAARQSVGEKNNSFSTRRHSEDG